MNRLILGNLICFGGSLLLIGGGLLKTKKAILWGQCAQFTLLSAGNFVIGAVTGGIADLLCLVRNIICLYLPYTLPVKLGIIAAQLGLSVIFQEMTLVDWLPLLAAVVFTLLLDTKSEERIKWLTIMAQLMWMIYDLNYQNYLPAICDVFCIVTNLIGIRMLRRERQTLGKTTAAKPEEKKQANEVKNTAEIGGLEEENA